jgi:hypothetical protein
VGKQIKIENGNYVVTKVKPLITSTLGSVPKDKKKKKKKKKKKRSVRLIYDASMPSNFCFSSLVAEK